MAWMNLSFRTDIPFVTFSSSKYKSVQLKLQLYGVDELFRLDTSWRIWDEWHLYSWMQKRIYISTSRRMSFVLEKQQFVLTTSNTTQRLPNYWQLHGLLVGVVLVGRRSRNEQCTRIITYTVEYKVHWPRAISELHRRGRQICQSARLAESCKFTDVLCAWRLVRPADDVYAAAPATPALALLARSSEMDNRCRASEGVRPIFTRFTCTSRRCPGNSF